MSLSSDLLELAEAHPALLLGLSTVRGARWDATGRRTGNPYPPIPIRPEVSDLLTDMARCAAAWESALREAFLMGTVYWTKPRNVAVPQSLEWSAGIVDDPPEYVDTNGFPHPGMVPNDVHSWMEQGSSRLLGGVRALGLPPAPKRTLCRPCGRQTKFTDPMTGNTLCISCNHWERAS